ncbi:MAG: zinc-dependent metalloprotease [Actinomycetota bacterium]|jgi:putative hydrolase|nr:zinc-dependent metalloprotease [Actinomycetota bacterium]
MELPDLPGMPGGGNFMEQFLADLLRMMGSGLGPASAKVDMARAMAQGVAGEGQPEGNVDPMDRMAIEELLRVAELHVGELTGLEDSDLGRLQLSAVGPAAWAWQSVDDWAFVLDAAADATAQISGLLPGQTSLDDDGPPGISELLARAMSTMGPVLASMQLGSAVGHLARHTVGQYELPVPRPDSQHQRLLIVPANIDRFAADWSLPQQDARLWVCLRDTTIHMVFGQPQVAERFRQLLASVARTTAEDHAHHLGALEGFDPSDPESLQRLLGDPESLFGGEPSPQRHRMVETLTAAGIALSGYVEHVLDRAASRLLGGRNALAEAWRRRLVERDESTRAAEMLLGLALEPAQLDQGVAFVNGVVERAGEASLRRLWSSATSMPTPAEISAPGLWLERIDLPS